MAEYSVNYLLNLINAQVKLLENINTCLSKAEALAQVALGDNFLDYPNVSIYNFLWALSDIIEQAKSLNEKSLNTLLKRRPFPDLKIVK